MVEREWHPLNAMKNHKTLKKVLVNFEQRIMILLKVISIIAILIFVKRTLIKAP